MLKDWCWYTVSCLLRRQLILKSTSHLSCLLHTHLSIVQHSFTLTVFWFCHCMFTFNMSVILMIAVNVWVKESPKRATLNELRDLMWNSSLKQKCSYSQKRELPEWIIVNNIIFIKTCSDYSILGLQSLKLVAQLR